MQAQPLHPITFEVGFTLFEFPSFIIIVFIISIILCVIVTSLTIGCREPMMLVRMSTGTGNTMVLLFSAEMLFRVCRYLSWGGCEVYRECETNLESCRTLCDHLSSMPEGPAGLVLPLGSYHLGPRVPRRLRLSCHRSL